MNVKAPRYPAVALWKLLDDIDTLDDACKGDDATFRKLCYDIQRQRFDILSGDEFVAMSSSPRLDDEALKLATDLINDIGSRGFAILWAEDRSPVPHALRGQMKAAWQSLIIRAWGSL